MFNIFPLCAGAGIIDALLARDAQEGAGRWPPFYLCVGKLSKKACEIRAGTSCIFLIGRRPYPRSCPAPSISTKEARVGMVWMAAFNSCGDPNGSFDPL